MASLFTPAECVGCGAPLANTLKWVCVECQANMPITNFHLERENPMAQRLKEMNPAIENATAQYYYVTGGRWREVIHTMKYRKGWRLAYRVGYWYGVQLAMSPLYQDIDLVIGVPLHLRRLLTRRYNQSEKIAEGIADALATRFNRRAIKRVRNNPSQVSIFSNEQRWRNVQSLFEVRHRSDLEGLHILLVDDVFTTGATLSSCVEAILESVPTCRVSVATIAISRRNIEHVI
ncbi:MAG: phosphoribosyltransferase family protein [Rikenellaceae bacterium]